MGRVYLGVFLVHALFQALAISTDSVFGERGVLIAFIVVIATYGASLMLSASDTAPRSSAGSPLGLGLPTGRAVLAAVGISLVMLGFYPLAALVSGSPVALRDGWYGMLPGLFAQGGVAEEVLFRGYLYGQLRRARSFWGAVRASIPPFALAHLALFATMEAPVAATATGLAIVLSVPLARLFDLGRSSIWACAIVHFVVQSAPKLALAPAIQLELSVGWMLLAMLVPWLVFLIRAPGNEEAPRAR